MVTKADIKKLIEEVFRYGDYDRRGRAAVDGLSQIGEPAIPVLVQTLRKPPESDLHPRDLWDSVQAVFCGLAKTASDTLIDLMEEDDSHTMSIIWALGHATGKRSITVLIEALKHKDQYVRWSAAESLIRRRSKRAIDPLIEALRDRSSMVRFTVVHAMKSNRMYRKREALESLRRIVTNKTTKKHHAGLWREAQDVIDKIEDECGAQDT